MKRFITMKKPMMRRHGGTEGDADDVRADLEGVDPRVGEDAEDGSMPE